MGILAESPLYIDDTATSTVMEIKTKARRLQMEYGLGMIIVDYLQLMENTSGAESRVQAVADMTRGLKAVARELNVPVIVLSQLSRAPEARTPAIPRLADLRESGSIEQDADVVLFIYRKAFDKSYHDIPPEEKNLADIIIAKHRNGPTGTVKLFFDETRTTFKNLEKRVDEGQAPPPF
jgi:replicative DNA helicase